MDDSKYGQYLPEQRYNFDQVPLPFVCDITSKTVDEKGANRVWVRQAGAGLEKRQATVHLTLRAAGKQPKPIIVFRGKGLRISASEKASWDPRVSVLFQPKAWVDRQIFSQIVELYKEDEAINTGKANLFFCDNLDAQIQDDAVKTMADDLNAYTWFLPPGFTDFFQPVDAGAGRQVKHHSGEELDRLLDEDDEFFEKWTKDTTTASYRRIMMTRFVGSAWQRMTSKNDAPFRRLFEKTGCLMTVDGSGDDKIEPQELDGYRFSRPGAASGSAQQERALSVERGTR